MAKGIYKWSLNTRSEIIRLYGLELQSISSISLILGISRSTLNYWIKKYNLKPDMELLREESVKSSILKGLVKNASGAESIEEKQEYIEEINGQPVKITKTIKRDKPCSKSIQVLARKYEKPLSDNRTLTDNEAANNLNINIGKLDYHGMSMRELVDSSSSSVLGVIEVDAMGQDAMSQDDSAMSQDDSASSYSPRKEGCE